MDSKEIIYVVPAYAFIFEKHQLNAKCSYEYLGKMYWIDSYTLTMTLKTKSLSNYMGYFKEKADYF